MRSTFLVLLFSASLFADPITVTILNQTDQVTAQAADFAGECSDTSAFAANCSVSGSVNSVASAAAYISSGTLRAYTIANEAYAVATASMTDTVLITGGTGTGYLNLVFGASNQGPYSGGESLGANDQSGRLYSGAVATDAWGIFSFQFDQPFTFQISLFEATDPSDTLDDGQVSLYTARIYTSAPTSCGRDYQTGYYGLCSDPNYVSADILGAIQTVLSRTRLIWRPARLSAGSLFDSSLPPDAKLITLAV